MLPIRKGLSCLSFNYYFSFTKMRRDKKYRIKKERKETLCSSSH